MAGDKQIYLDISSIILMVFFFGTALLLWVGELNLKMPSTDFKIAEIVKEEVPTPTPVSVTRKTAKPKRKKEKKPLPVKNKVKRPLPAKKKVKKKAKKFTKLHEDCVLALVALGYKKSEATSAMKGIFRNNNHIKTVEEFLRSM